MSFSFEACEIVAVCKGLHQDLWTHLPTALPLPAANSQLHMKQPVVTEQSECKISEFASNSFF